MSKQQGIPNANRDKVLVRRCSRGGPFGLCLATLPLFYIGHVLADGFRPLSEARLSELLDMLIGQGRAREEFVEARRRPEMMSCVETLASINV
jgi:hypothetical protein